MANKYFKTGKFAYEMLVPTVKKNLKERRKHFEDVVKGTDKYTKSLTDEGKIAVKKNVSPTVSKISKIMDKKDAIGPGSSNPRAKRAGGGMMRSRMGLKRGGGKFPDLNKDGKTTFADVLIGRGVLPKNKKKKMMAKKSKSPMDKAIKKNKKRFV